MALKFRRALLGDGFAVQLARLQVLPPLKDAAQIRVDIERTFPHHPVQDLAEKLVEVLAMFASQHPKVAYAQGQNFLCAPLFWVYWQDAPSYALKDTLYSLGRLHKLCLPLYPLDRRDGGPLIFCRAIARCLGSYFSNWNEEHNLYAQSYVLHFWGSLFANLFSMEDVLVLWAFLVEPETDRERILRLFKFTLEMIRKHARILDLGGAAAFAFLSHPAVHQVERLTRCLRERGREDRWPVLPPI